MRESCLVYIAIFLPRQRSWLQEPRRRVSEVWEVPDVSDLYPARDKEGLNWRIGGK